MNGREHVDDEHGETWEKGSEHDGREKGKVAECYAIQRSNWTYFGVSSI